MTSPLAAARAELDDLAPVLRRCVGLDPSVLARVRLAPGTAGVLVRLPFRVLVARTVAAREDLAVQDITVRAADLLGWLDGTDPAPRPRDAEWRGATPPGRGWRRVDTVPDDAIRRVVRSGALALKQAGGGSSRGDALLDSVVLTVDGQGGHAEITLRTVSALTRMGFLKKGSHAKVDRCGRWTRVAGAFGSVYAEEPGGLSVAAP